VYVAYVNNEHVSSFYEEAINKNKFELVTTSDILWQLLFLRTKYVNIVSCSVKGKGKAIPLQAWTGTKGFRRLRLPDFKKIGT
jgi:hypothetical protein